MSRYRLVGLLAVLLALIAGCALGTQPVGKGKVLLIATEHSEDMGFMLAKEVGVMMSMLKDAGFTVVVASESGELLEGGSMTTTLQPDLKLADVKTANYAGFIIPGMGANTLLPPFRAQVIVKEAVALGRPVAAQSDGVAMLQASASLKGKKFAMVDELKHWYPSGVYQGEGVVQDGNIITSGVCPLSTRYWGKPDGTVALTQKFIDALASVR